MSLAPKCALPTWIVRWPAVFSSAGKGVTCMVCSVPAAELMPLRFHAGGTMVSLGFSGDWFLRRVQLVTRCRAAFIPVSALTRVGEHISEAYARVNFAPWLASRSMLGVRYQRFKAVTSL